MIGYFCWPSVPAGKLGIQEMEGAKLDPKDPVWMAHLILPIGFSWSLYLAEDPNLNQLQNSGSMVNSHSMTELGSPWILKRGVDSKPNYLYVDNVGFLSDKTASHFNHIG